MIRAPLAPFGDMQLRGLAVGVRQRERLAGSARAGQIGVLIGVNRRVGAASLQAVPRDHLSEYSQLAATQPAADSIDVF
jgi:hypothetical protein